VVDILTSTITGRFRLVPSARRTAVLAMTRSLAWNGTQGVRTVAIAPGVSTPGLRPTRPEGRDESWAQRNPLAAPASMANLPTCKLLISDQAGYINGDGGRMAAPICEVPVPRICYGPMQWQKQREGRPKG
jgi:NAD(P)-dependent dehydrogenase (short-subunit alcohol dehydrogenase family)